MRYSFGRNTIGNLCANFVDDINADNILDLIFCQGNAGTADVVGFQLGVGNGTFQTPTDIVSNNQFPVPKFYDGGF
jgi:hypothetical protein